MERGLDTKERILEAAQSLVLERGFSGTTLDDILKATGVTKGAFFHHFKSKGDLAQKLVARFEANDFALFSEWNRRAEALADDPYQALVLYMKFFEEWLDGLPEPFAGCLFAAYVYESRLFEPAINDFIHRAFARWQRLYEARFAAAIAVQKPRLEVTAAELAESIVSLLEGAFILARAHADPTLISRQSRLFRGYLGLVFGDPA